MELNDQSGSTVSLAETRFWVKWLHPVLECLDSTPGSGCGSSQLPLQTLVVMAQIAGSVPPCVDTRTEHLTHGFDLAFLNQGIFLAPTSSNIEASF